MANNTDLNRIYDRFDLDPKTGCWVWNGRTDNRRRGCISVKNKPVSVCRVSYQLAFGPIQTGKHIRHSCKSVLCINPAHLIAVESDFSEIGITTRLTAEDAIKIREMYGTKKYTQKDLARKFSVSQIEISMIIRGDGVWSKVNGGPIIRHGRHGKGNWTWRAENDATGTAG